MKFEIRSGGMIDLVGGDLNGNLASKANLGFFRRFLGWPMKRFQFLWVMGPGRNDPSLGGLVRRMSWPEFSTKRM